jgi:uncharacterized membrane protein YhaH (DUF805 family)
MRTLLRLSQWIFVGILAYAPLHILLSTWFGTSFDVLPAAKVAKDIVVVWGLGMATAAYLSRYSLRKLISDKLIALIVVYALLTAGMAVIKPTDPDAEILGIVFNLRFLAVFVYGYMLSRLDGRDWVRTAALRAVFASAIIVLVFGVLQYLLLPNDALRHVGYTRENGVLPAFFIDDKPDLERIMSTQRDPNSLGSYILIVIGLAGALWAKRKQYRMLTQGILTLSVLCLWYTFSRSAWIGAVITLLTLAVLGAGKYRLSPHRLKQAGIAAAILLTLGLGTLYAAKDTYFVQNVVFHADESTTLEDPNELRVRFYQESLDEIADNPLGYGPGTAGLASIRNDVQGTRLNENYYLQIATEVGLIGLALFVAILAVTARRLHALCKKGDWLAIGLLASFAGLAFTNLLVHIWATEAVAYTWWALAGLLLGTMTPRSKNTPQTPKRTRIRW